MAMYTTLFTKGLHLFSVPSQELCEIFSESLSLIIIWQLSSKVCHLSKNFKYHAFNWSPHINPIL